MLIDIEPLIDIIKLTLQTGYVKHLETPVNLILIAKPESGKTSAMSTFKRIKGTYMTNNLTQAVIVSKILPMIEHKGLKHLIIPDILNCIQKDRRTQQGFVNMIKSLIEEGITSLDTFHMRTSKVYDPPVRCGLITAITTDSFKGHYNEKTQRFESGVKHYWKRIGLASRFVPFTYEYEISKILKIFESIRKEEHRNPMSKQAIKRKMADIKGNPRLLQQLELLSQRIGMKVGGYGIRTMKSLMALTKANAMLNVRTEVAKRDIKKILYLGNWMNYEFNPL